MKKSKEVYCLCELKEIAEEAECKNYIEALNNAICTVAKYSSKFWLRVVGEKRLQTISTNNTAKRVVAGGEHEGTTAWYECDRCGTVVDPGDNYCKNCGRKLEGEE